MGSVWLPANVMCEPDRHLKRIDFGIAKRLDPLTGPGTLTLARASATHGFAAVEAMREIAVARRPQSVMAAAAALDSRADR